jgi:hypothetical protein
MARRCLMVSDEIIGTAYSARCLFNLSTWALVGVLHSTDNQNEVTSDALSERIILSASKTCLKFLINLSTPLLL